MMLSPEDPTPNLESWAGESLILRIAAVLTAIYAIYEIIKRLIGFIKSLYSMVNKIDFIYSELNTNGGKSIKDIVNRIEHNLSIKSQREKAILNESSVAMFEIDKKGKLIWVNKKFTELTGENTENISQNNWTTILEKSDQEEVLKQLKQSQLNGWWIELNNCTIINEHVKKSFICSLKLSPLSFKDDIVGWFGMIRLKNNF